MMGVIVGGWEFVWAAYAVTAVVLLGYAVSVHLRYRAERARREREERAAPEAGR
jgi:heme exporter protein CcmD